MLDHLGKVASIRKVQHDDEFVVFNEGIIVLDDIDMVQ